MSKEQESLKTEIYGLLKSRGFDPISKDSSGDTVPVPEEAEVFEFMFSKDGKDYGKVWVTLDGLKQLIIYYGKEVADSPKNGSQDSNSFSQLTNVLKRFATNRQLSFERSDQSNLEADMAKREHTKKQEQINEGYYPIGRTTSGNNNIPTVTMRIQHTRPIEEGEQRYRNIAKIFVENQLGERILLPTNKPGLARTFVRHIAEGGKPNDDRWNHLNSLCEEYQKMAGFVRATRNGQFNESAQNLVNEGISHYQKLRETLNKLSGKRGYNEYFDNYTPALMEDEEQIDLSEMFMSSTLDPRIESVMPILSKLSKNISETKDMAETIALGEWADSLMDSTIKSNDDSDDYVEPEEADYDSPEWQETERRAGEFMSNVKKREVAKRMHDILSKGKDQGVAEGVPLGYSTDPAQAKWYHEGRKAYKYGTTSSNGLIKDIARKHGCPPEWLKAFSAGYQDQEGWGKDDVSEDLDSEQKSVGQLGPTAKYAKKGDLVGTMEGTYSKDVEKAFPGGKAPGVKTGASAPKGTSTMPKDKEKAKGQPVKEGQEDLDAILRIIKK